MKLFNLHNFKYRFKFLKELFPHLGKLRKHIVICLIVSIIYAVIEIINPYIYKIFIDSVLVGGQFNKIRFIIAGYLILFAATVTCQYIRFYFFTRINTTLSLKIKQKVLSIFMNRNMNYYENYDIGEVKMNIEDDTGQVGKFINSQGLDLIISHISLIFSLVIMFILEWRLALFAIILIPITFVLDNTLSKQEAVINNETRINQQQLYNWLNESIISWKEVKALSLHKTHERQYIKFLNVAAKCYIKWINIWATRALVIPKIKNELLMQFGIYFFGGLLIINGKLTIGGLVMFISYYAMLAKSVMAVSGSNAELQANMPITDRLLSLLNNNAEEKEKSNITDISLIEFNHVWFRYNDYQNYIVKDLNLQIDRGDKIGIIGKSGCGKTTLLKLLTGILKAEKGEINISGIDINKINTNSLFNHIGYVMQDSVLFSASIRENLLLGKETASQDELIEACKKACLYDFICSLDDGFDTKIGENGIKLSGGQRQRLVLARLLLTDPDVFVFDEPTSNLDQHNEALICEAINNIATDKTIIIVTHRPSLLEVCNRIIDFEKICG